MKKGKFFIFLTMFFLILTAGHGAVAETRMIIGVDPDYNVFDPGRAYEMYANTVLNVLYDNLVKFEGQNDIPVLSAATSMDIADDNLIYTFKLRNDIKFISGNRLTSKDVKWSFDRVRNLKSNPAFLAEKIKSVETPDEQTVIIHMVAPDASFVSKLATSAFGILDSETVRSHGGTADANASKTDKVQNWLTQNSAGSGPYILKKFVPDSELVLVKNPAYWQKAPGVDRIMMKVMKDANSQLLTLQKGDIDIAFNINAEHIKQLKAKKDIKTISTQTKSIIFLLMNMDREIGGPFSNPDVQNAVRYALDYRGLQAIAGPGSVTPSSFIQKGYMGALPPRDPDFADLAKAKELLAKAGYPDGFDATIDVATFAMEGVSFVTLGEKIASDLTKVGIRTKIHTAERLVSRDLYRNGKMTFAIRSWSPDYPDPNNQFAFLPGEPVGRRARWQAEDNPDLVKLTQAAKVETNDAKRIEILKKIQEITFMEGPWAVILQLPRHYATRANIGNAYYTPYLLELDQITKD